MNPTTFTNTHYNKAAAQTYSPLYVYYRPPDYYNSNGYYSNVFLLVYYDGYGYNFYYGDFGYYEYSLNEAPPGVTPTPVYYGGGGDGGGGGGVVLIFIGVICCCFCCGVYCAEKNKNKT